MAPKVPIMRSMRGQLAISTHLFGSPLAASKACMMVSYMKVLTPFRLSLWGWHQRVSGKLLTSWSPEALTFIKLTGQGLQRLSGLAQCVTLRPTCAMCHMECCCMM